jgi:hypothetical protein
MQVKVNEWQIVVTQKIPDWIIALKDELAKAIMYSTMLR